MLGGSGAKQQRSGSPAPVASVKGAAPAALENETKIVPAEQEQQHHHEHQTAAKAVGPTRAIAPPYAPEDQIQDE